ncbi:MAG: hypothetical protein PHP57_06365 [Sideroxydans sp.]|nr:hypothetical protein [Sideroxydans sp.]
MEMKLTENDIADAAVGGYINGVAHGRELQKEENKKAWLKKQQKPKKALPVKKVEPDANSLALYDQDKNIGHFEMENALAGLTTALEIKEKNKRGWRLERVEGTTKLTFIMPSRINSHAVSTLLKVIQMYKQSGNLNGDLVTTLSALAKTSDSKPSRDNIMAIFNDLESLAEATIKGEEYKKDKKIEWGGEKAFLSYIKINDGIKITLAPRIAQSIDQNWSFARIDLNMRSRLSSVGQDLHLYLSSWIRFGAAETELDKLLAHVFEEGAGDIYWQRNRLKKALVELEQMGSFKHKLSKQRDKKGHLETMVSVWK